MTVKELMAELANYPEDMEVFQIIEDGLYTVSKAEIAKSYGELKEIVGEEFVLID